MYHKQRVQTLQSMPVLGRCRRARAHQVGQYLRSCFRLSTLLLRVSQDTSLMRTNASSSYMALKALGLAEHGLELRFVWCGGAPRS